MLPTQYTPDTVLSPAHILFTMLHAVAMLHTESILNKRFAVLCVRESC